jgi:glycosyltransferase involved in cell wall biosynthesis
MPFLANKLPKIMSYQRHTGGRQIALAARIGGRSLQFTGCSDFISAQGRRSAGTWRTIHNFVEPQRFTFAESVAPSAPLVFLSRIESIKGPDLAIEIARAAGRRLILAGNRASEGAEHRFWMEKIEPQLGRNGVEWIGEVDDTQKNALLGGAAALLVPVRWDEPFGIVFAESLACGTPILSRPLGALPEIVAPGKTGWLFDSTADGAAAARRVGELDRGACRRAAETRFSIESSVSQYLALYREMVVVDPREK